MIREGNQSVNSGDKMLINFAKYKVIRTIWVDCIQQWLERHFILVFM